MFRNQEMAKRRLTVAAGGGHDILMVGANLTNRPRLGDRTHRFTIPATRSAFHAGRRHDARIHYLRFRRA